MGLLGTLFGKSAKSTSKSWNDAAPWVNETYKPAAQQGLSGISGLSDFVGGGYDNFLDKTGFKFGMNEGMSDLNDRFHSLGLGRSGSAMKAAVQYGNDYSRNQGWMPYAGLLGQLGQLGLGAGQLVAGANQRSEGTSKGGSGGLLGSIGQAAGLFGLFSDRRLKADVEKIGEEPDGLGTYRYRYLGESETRVGHMADEVAEKRPWALGPTVGGYATIRPDRLEA